LFASKDGITAFITPDGRIAKAAPKREATVLTATIQPMYGITPWLTNGLDPLLFIVLLFLGLATLRERQIKQANLSSKKQTACVPMPPSNLSA
jgi:apolipoprotein N-acyltransferase